MKLRYSPTSPFVRKVIVAASELGLGARIEREATDPWNPDTDLARDNPLGKVPALVTDDGQVLYDSPVICEYLDALAGGGRLFPAAGTARWRALRQQALADGVMDAAAAAVIERMRRPEQYRWPEHIARQLAAVRRGVAALERDLGTGATDITIGQVSTACALGYLDFRHSDLNWRDHAPALAAWYEQFSARPSMRDSVPRAA